MVSGRVAPGLARIRRSDVARKLVERNAEIARLRARVAELEMEIRYAAGLLTDAEIGIRKLLTWKEGLR